MSAIFPRMSLRLICVTSSASVVLLFVVKSNLSVLTILAIASLNTKMIASLRKSSRIMLRRPLFLTVPL